MARVRHFAICVVLLRLFICPIAAADPVSLESNPGGIYLSLDGPVSVSGTGPLPITQLPVGEYRLTADHPAFPAVRGRFVRTEGDFVSRSWAGKMALLLPPGFVHLERGEKRGLCHLGACLTSVAMNVVSRDWIKDSEDQLTEATAAYHRAVSEREITATRSDRHLALQEKNDAEDINSLWLKYFALNWLAAGVESILFTPQPELTSGRNGVYTVSLPSSSGFKSAIMSSLVPGAGQRYMGHSKKSNFFFTATAALAAGAIFAQESYLEAKRDQADAQRRFYSARAEAELNLARQRLQKTADDTDDKNSIRWAFAGAAAGVYLWNIFDAFGLGSQIDVPGLALSAAPASDGVYICASWSIR